ncbi:hypothetical protein R3P38DRAFT_3096001 [Favolaschia claudopus]|uniref:Secreted protein n=1 Tax=Favolaschia claudopus TaxID=2862362 RepID=A0AAV9ZP85_9AGAR
MREADPYIRLVCKYHLGFFFLFLVLTSYSRGKRITRPNPGYYMTSPGSLSAGHHDFEPDNDGSVDRLVLGSQSAGQWRAS